MFKISNVVNALRNVSCFSKVANLFKNCSQFSINDLKLKKCSKFQNSRFQKLLEISKIVQNFENNVNFFFSNFESPVTIKHYNIFMSYSTAICDIVS